MNRRDFLSTGFKLGAAGLLLPVIEPVRRVWALDRTMVPAHSTKHWYLYPSGEYAPITMNMASYTIMRYAGPLHGWVTMT